MMKTWFIFFTLNNFTASIQILFLLLVAAIIGYITAWLYSKSIHHNQINDINSEIEKLRIQIANLIKEKIEQYNNINKQESEIKHLTIRINALKSLHIVTLNGSDGIHLKAKRSEKMMYESELSLAQIISQQHLLNYESFGRATIDEKDDLKMISGIGSFIEERLHALHIYTFQQISKFSDHDVESIGNAIEYFSGRIERDAWIEQAQELVWAQEKRDQLFKRIIDGKDKIFYDRIGTANKDEVDDLTLINGIGGWIKEKLNLLEIFTFRQIGNFTEEDIQAVTEVIEYFPGRIERDEWIIQANELVRIAGNKADLLKRISDREDRNYYRSLMTSEIHQANNLTRIKGISLWIEERLNMLDIYSFEQISKLKAGDIENIAGLLVISPERIKDENWIGQAKGLIKKPTSISIN